MSPALGGGARKVGAKRIVFVWESHLSAFGFPRVIFGVGGTEGGCRFIVWPDEQDQASSKHRGKGTWLSLRPGS